MDDVRDAFAALFSRIRGVAWDDLTEEERRPFRIYGDAALGVVRDNRELLFYAFGLPPESSNSDVLQIIRRQHIAIGRAIENRPAETTTTFPCPGCGATLTVRRSGRDYSKPIETTCKCGRLVKIT
jgi:predicted RNA-binding Zn-ribbon protein involved in translation (DUF1610 family)